MCDETLLRRFDHIIFVGNETGWRAELKYHQYGVDEWDTGPWDDDEHGYPEPEPETEIAISLDGKVIKRISERGYSGRTAAINTMRRFFNDREEIVKELASLKKSKENVARKIEEVEQKMRELYPEEQDDD